MPRRAVAAVLAAAVVGLAACTPEPAIKPAPPTSSSVPPDGFREPPPGAGPERYTQQPLDWQRCGDHECAEVAAPLDWADPDRQAITLSMLRVPADGEPRGTIFVNPGGPGGSGKDLAQWFQRDGLTDYDIVGWDPRGVDDSTPVQCGDTQQTDEFLAADVSPDDQAEVEQLNAVATEYGELCRANSGELLEHVSTKDSAADLDLLRQLVGDDQLNYLGYSYGTELGAVYADTYPERVGRLVLDSAVDISPGQELTDQVSQAEGFSRVLTDFAEWCVAHDACALGESPKQVTDAVAQLLTDLDAEPLRVGNRELTQSLGVNGVMHPLYQTEDSWLVLAEAITRARAGDGSWLLKQADDYNMRTADGYRSLMDSFHAIRCTSEVDEGLQAAYEDAEVVSRTVDVLGPFMGVDNVCPLWPVEPNPNPQHMTAAGADPIMVVGSRGDSATPFEYSEGMAEQLESGFLVTWEGSGHGTYGGTSRCVDEAVVAYFHDRQPAEDLVCRE